MLLSFVASAVARKKTDVNNNKKRFQCQVHVHLLNMEYTLWLWLYWTIFYGSSFFLILLSSFSWQCVAIMFRISHFFDLFFCHLTWFTYCVLVCLFLIYLSLFIVIVIYAQTKKNIHDLLFNLRFSFFSTLLVKAAHRISMYLVLLIVFFLHFNSILFYLIIQLTQIIRNIEIIFIILFSV